MENIIIGTCAKRELVKICYDNYYYVSTLGGREGAYIMIMLYYFYFYYYYNISPVTRRLRRSSIAHACVGFPGNKLRGGGASRARLDDSRRRRPRERSDHAIIAHSFTHTQSYYLRV